tara:strand:+ start:4832 stop:6634 length:1803 start_codon:yes stop_codon:yes gene_type:complete
MCGIFALLNNYTSIPRNYLYKQFQKGQHRGPENSVMEEVMVKATFGFHRLAINGIDDSSNQPIRVNNITLICNGEIYNYKELYKLMSDVKPQTNSDCEVIIHLYIKYGIEHTLQMLDGVFAFCLLDNSDCFHKSKLYIARDPYGVRPIYAMQSNKDKMDSIYGFSSELKQLTGICDTLNVQNRNLKNPHKYSIQHFKPGTYSEFEMLFASNSSWKCIDNYTYHKPGFTSCINRDIVQSDCIYNIQKYLKLAVEKRCSTTDRPIACLLSGGLDSSLITTLVNEYHKKNKLPTLETYSIGLEGAEDLKFARTVADYLSTKHTEIIVSEQDYLDAIPYVIQDIESYDTTTVRASIGNWLLGKYISKNSEAKVIFNGDGSDEVLGGYLYVGHANNAIEFDKECRRLLTDIHKFDVLRSDKCISSHGLEPRTPFLDREFVQYYLTIPFELRYHTLQNNAEKYLLRTAFDEKNILNSNNQPFLPSNVLWRRKEAFSDGVSHQNRSLYKIIEEYTNKYIEENLYSSYIFRENTENAVLDIVNNHSDFDNINNHLIPQTTEQLYYRYIFEKHYNGYGKVVPYFWMPKYVDATDSSARTLSIYKNSITL